MGKFKQKIQQELNEQRRRFLLTFFENEEGYAETEVNGFWLIKSWNGTSEKWQVAIYTQESYNNYKEYNNRKQLTI